MAVLARHPDLNRTGAVIGLNVRSEEWWEAYERGEKCSSSSSMGFSSSPPFREGSQLGVGSQSSGHAKGAQASKLRPARPGSVEGSEGWVVDQREGT